VDVLDPPSAFQPLMPDQRALGPSLERAAELVAEGHRLEAAAGTLRVALQPLLRSMNSYYTNKIEGQHTRPAEIERALAREFVGDKREARKQRLAVAHIETEEELEAEVPKLVAVYYEPARVQRIHANLFGRLPPHEQTTDEGQSVVPGAWRHTRVTAGRHVSPAAEAIPALLSAWQQAYSALPGIELALVGAACSHHRLLWVHPFLDGNGRAARLHTHLVLTALGVTQGLWSPLRGLARQHEAYYARLNNADLPRRNDLDGRGPLSQEELVGFASWFLEVCVDQARFIGSLLALSDLRSRIDDLLRWLSAHPWSVNSERSVVKPDAVEAVHYVAIAGPIERARFMAMTGLPERTARRVLSSLLHFGVLTTPSSRAPVSFGVPLRSLRFLFPRLWPEAEADVAE
jgi:Fic family protein